MIVTSTDIKGLKKHATGKVRDIYDLGEHLLIIASDRISAFDVILPSGIPDKGRVLTQISMFWFDLTKDIIDNHVVTADIDEILKYIAKAGAENPEDYREMLDGRSMVTLKASPCPIECVVRGYLAGSAWKEYSILSKASADSNSIVLHGIEMQKNMLESQKLPKAVFTPSTKETSGHDINISVEKASEIVGEITAKELEAASLAVYLKASEYAAKRGLIICDTKFEFGYYNDSLIIIDEVLTPDSSRFWDASVYEPGKGQPSFDKQFVRDYLLTLDWDQTYPGPELPADIIEKTADKYREAYRRVVGKEL